tara:strand:- start:100 stop:684 length:585 start_codon:yes stop_codon:yes gene_type:complete
MLDDVNKINKERLFEIELIKIMKENPKDEIAEELISLFVKHSIKKTKPSKELVDYIKYFLLDIENDSIKERIKSIVKKIGRPLYEHNHIAMNSLTWQFILSGYTIFKAYEETANVFSTNSTKTKQAFERKNHDFGKRELCRIGLDVFIIISNHKFSFEDEKIVADILKEPLTAKVLQDEIHLKNKYKELLNMIF